MVWSMVYGFTNLVFGQDLIKITQIIALKIYLIYRPCLIMTIFDPKCRKTEAERGFGHFGSKIVIIKGGAVYNFTAPVYS